MSSDAYNDSSASPVGFVVNDAIKQSLGAEVPAMNEPEMQTMDNQKIELIDDQNTPDPTPSLEEKQSVDDNGNATVEQNVDTKPRLQYTKEVMYKLMRTPASMAWPDDIDCSLQKGPGKLIDLDRLVKMVQDRKKPSGAPADNPLATNPTEKHFENEPKKSRDPRERIRQEEQDGIVLSPQRRSFGTGCRVQNSMNALFNNKRPESPADAPPPRESHRELPSRRIGSGRIVRREDPEHYERDPRDQRDPRDPRDQRDPRDMREDPRRNHRDWRTKNEAKYDKYRDERHDKRRRYYEEDRRQPDLGDQRDRRYGNHRQHRVEEAPEWFTGGPSSQKDCIELVGFDDAEEDHPNWKNQKDVNKKETAAAPPTNSQVKDSHKGNEAKLQSNPVVIEPMEDPDAMNFDINNIILGDFLNIGSDNPSTTSRLSQYFSNYDHSSTEDQKPNNAQTHLSSLMNSPYEPPQPPPDTSHFFTPIAPASTSNGIATNDLRSVSDAPTMQDLIMGGKGHSLQDIEAELHKPRDMATRQDDKKKVFNDFLMNGSKHETPFGGHHTQPALPIAPTEGDLLAIFAKTGQRNGPGNMSRQNPLSRTCPLPNRNPMSHPMQQPPTLNQLLGNDHSDAPPPNYLAPPHSQASQERLLNMMHQNKSPQLLHPGFQPHIDPIKQLVGGVPMNNPPPNQNFNSEVQVLLHRLVTGQVSEAQLLGQWNAHGTNMHQRDTISTVLQIVRNNPVGMMSARNTLTPSPTPQVGGLQFANTPISLSPRVASPNPEGPNMLSAPNHMLSQRVSPLMFNGPPQRLPFSHQELVAHTKSILQKALLKQGLEKAKEKHRKRDTERINPLNNIVGPPQNHIHRDVSPPKAGPKSQSPLAFTPTSVMRKMTMTGEKDRIEKTNGIIRNETIRNQNSSNQNYAQNPAPNPFHGMHGNMSQTHPILRNQPQIHPAPGMVGPHGIHHRGQPTPNLLQQFAMTNPNQNNNAFPNDHVLRVPQMGLPSHRTSPINLANIFGTDIAAQSQSGTLPEMPGGPVLSLEEVERLQQNLANTVQYNHLKFVR